MQLVVVGAKLDFIVAVTGNMTEALTVIASSYTGVFAQANPLKSDI